jgi:transposase
VGVSVGDDRVVTRAGGISDEFRAVEPVLLSAEGRRGRPWRDHREVLEAPWRDLPEDLVPWQTAWKRHRRWSVDGIYAEIFAAVRRAHGIDTADLDAGVRKLLSVDSTSVRAHQHAAGARSDTLTGGGIE